MTISEEHSDCPWEATSGRLVLKAQRPGRRLEAVVRFLEPTVRVPQVILGHLGQPEASSTQRVCRSEV